MLYPHRIAMALCFWLSYGLPRKRIPFNSHFWRQLLDRGLCENPEFFLESSLVLPLRSIRVSLMERELEKAGWQKREECKNSTEGLLPVMSQVFYVGNVLWSNGEKTVRIEWCDLGHKLSVEVSDPELEQMVDDMMSRATANWFDYFNARIKSVADVMPELWGSLKNISEGNPVPPRELLCRIQCYSEAEQQRLVEFLRWTLPEIASTCSTIVLN